MSRARRYKRREMMSRGPKAVIIELTDPCEQALRQIIRTQTNPQNLVRRAKIIIKAKNKE